MRLPRSPLVLQLAVICISCFGAVTRGRALSTSRLDSEPPLNSDLNTIAGETSGRFYHTDVTGSSDGRPEDLEDTPTPCGRTSSVGHEESLPGTGLHGRRESFVQESSQSDTLHRRREREAPKPWLSDDEGSGSSSETQWDDEDLFLQQRRGRKGGPTPGRRKNADWLQLQGVTTHHSGQKTNHGRQQAVAKNELPSQEQGPRPSRRPQHANAAKRRSKKRHRMKAPQPRSTRLPPLPEAEAAPRGGSGGRRSQRQRQRQRQHHQLKQPEQRPRHRTTTTTTTTTQPPPPPPPPRKFGGGDMSLESRIRALKKIATGAEEGEPTAAQPLELPAYYSGDSPRWGPQDEWASGYDQRLWKVLGSGGFPDYEDTGSAPPPPPQLPAAATPPPPPPPPPPTRPPPPGHSTAATPVIAGAAAHIPQPTQSRHFAYHRVTEAQSAAAAASHHQEAFVAVSMVELPANHSREHPARGHDTPHQAASAESVSTRAASWQAAGTTTAASLFPAAAAGAALSGGEHWASGGRSGGLQPLPTWLRLRHRGRNHFRKGAMEELMNRHREEQWLRRRLGLPPESPHQHFAG